ncbi:MAG: polysaccharide deacetylase family protein [Firmicutes bacterium]|nr:polysaccharide deacetylase family protein [Bacillota bacterium]
MFIVLFSSRTKIVSLLLLATVICAFFFKDHLTTCYTRHFHGVRSEVTFLGQELGGLTRDEVETIVAAKIGAWQTEPIDAHYEPSFNSIVPELWGYEIDIEETVDSIMSAPRAKQIAPVLKPLLPDVSMQDYPSAFIERGNPQKESVALMINVAWGTEHLRPMLKVLAAGDARATFFVVGRWAEQNEALLQEISRQGHLIANHGYSDAVVFPELTVERMEHSIGETNKIVRVATGQEPEYFTPHKGEYNELVLETISRQGMRTIMWSIDTVDWQEPGVEEMKARVLGNLHTGAIILAHPTAETVTLFKEIIPVINDKGFKLVTVDELLSPQHLPDEIR